MSESQFSRPEPFGSSGDVRNRQGAGTISRLAGCEHHTEMSITKVICFSWITTLLKWLKILLRTYIQLSGMCSVALFSHVTFSEPRLSTVLDPIWPQPRELVNIAPDWWITRGGLNPCWLITVFQPGIWLAAGIAPSQSEAMLENSY